MKPAVVFDFDGTIADSFPYVFEFLWREARKSGQASDTETESYRRMPMKQMAHKMGIPLWRMALLYFKAIRMMRSRLPDVQPFPGMLDVIKELHAVGHPIYVVSANSKRNIRSFLDLHDMQGIVRAVYAGATPFGKRRLLRPLVARHRLDPSASWMIGDLATDAESARSVGLRTIAVSWGFDSRDRLTAVADHVVDTPAEIIRTIEADES